MSDEYEPVISVASTVPEPSTTGEARRPTEVATAAPEGNDEPAGENARGSRTVSDRTRAMFKTIAARAAKLEREENGEPDAAADLVGMESEAATAPVARAAPATAPARAPLPAAASPAAQVAAAIVAAPPPVPAPAAPAAPVYAPAPAPPDVGKAAAEQAKLMAEMRAKQLDDREAALAAREKLLPDRQALIEKPAATLAAYIYEVYGVTDEQERKTVLADVMTELAEIGLGTTLPADAKQTMEGRKALRSVKAYQQNIAKERADLEAKRAAQDKTAAEEREKAELAQQERAAISKVGSLIEEPTMKAKLRYLHDAEATSGAAPAAIVWEVLKEQHARHQRGEGPEANWQAAAEYADAWFKSQAEATAKRGAYLQTLLQPTLPAPAAPAKAAASPGGAPGPAPKPQLITEAPAPVAEPEDGPLDWHEQRHQNLRRIKAKHLATRQPNGA